MIIAKLGAYGVGENSLRFMQNSLSQRQQRVKIGSSFSDWLETILGVSQGSALGPILFNAFINDLLLFIKETNICNFASDTTLYALGKELDNISFKLEIETTQQYNGLKIMKWQLIHQSFNLSFFQLQKHF